jgi:hypothetical protein
MFDEQEEQHTLITLDVDTAVCFLVYIPLLLLDLGLGVVGLNGLYIHLVMPGSRVIDLEICDAFGHCPRSYEFVT